MNATWSCSTLVTSHPGGITFTALRASLLDDYFGRDKDGAYSNAVKELVRRGEVRRQKGLWRSKLDERELLRRV